MSLSFNKYQQIAKTTAVYSKKWAVLYPALGLPNEAGEVAGKLKKVFRDNDGNLTRKMKADISKELGDVLWYVAALCTDLGLNLNDVAQENLDKLLDRQARGKLHGSGDNR